MMLNNATSITPAYSCVEPMQEELYMGQISMQITGADGSVLGANQHRPVGAMMQTRWWGQDFR
jgi:hypothetical protein